MSPEERADLMDELMCRLMVIWGDTTNLNRERLDVVLRRLRELERDLIEEGR